MTQVHTITGAALVGAAERFGAATFMAVNPATGEALSAFYESGAEDVADACALAEAAFASFSELSPASRGRFLEAISEEIVRWATRGDAAVAETALPCARIE